MATRMGSVAKLQRLQADMKTRYPDLYLNVCIDRDHEPFFERAAAARQITVPTLIHRLVAEIGREPVLIDNILDDAGGD